MRKLQLFVFLIFSILTFGQDGSDIRYFKFSDVNQSLIGQFIHIDFFNRSFAGGQIDTVSIIIDNKPTRFFEVRNDNGYNNWFSQQYLEAVQKVNGIIIRISKFKLETITSSSIQVTMYIDFYDGTNNQLPDKSIQYPYWFNKNDIVEVLIKSKQL
jgi:hypothetical protein